MKRSNHWIMLLVALFMASTARLNAQKLEPGTWTGTIVDPGGESADVTYLVAISGDTIQVTMSAPEGHTFSFSKVRFEEGKLLFSWEANTNIDCILNPAESGSYSGTCTDSSGASGQMTMVPPKKDG